MSSSLSSVSLPVSLSYITLQAIPTSPVYLDFNTRILVVLASSMSSDCWFLSNAITQSLSCPILFEPRKCDRETSIPFSCPLLPSTLRKWETKIIPAPVSSTKLLSLVIIESIALRSSPSCTALTNICKWSTTIHLQSHPIIINLSLVKMSSISLVPK